MMQQQFMISHLHIVDHFPFESLHCPLIVEDIFECLCKRVYFFRSTSFELLHSRQFLFVVGLESVEVNGDQALENFFSIFINKLGLICYIFADRFEHSGHIAVEVLRDLLCFDHLDIGALVDVYHAL